MNVRKRKFFSGVALSLVICLMFSLFPLGAFADSGTSVTDAVYGDSSVTDSVYGGVSVTSVVYDSDPSHFTYQTSGSNATITGYTGPGGDVVIPDTIDGYPVKSIFIDAFKGKSEIFSVVIPEGVTYIWKGAFSMMPNLTSVTIPEGVTSIGEGAFAENKNLTSLTLPSTLNDLGFGAFYGTGLTSIEIPPYVTSISENAFASTKLETVVIPSTVTDIGTRAFYFCFNLKSIVIENPNTVISDVVIGTIPQQTTIVGHVGSFAEEYAIANNINFKDITTGTDVPEIDNGGQDPISRYHRGEDVIISDLFEDEDLATYFVEWMSYEWGEKWSVTDVINKEDVESRIMWLYTNNDFSFVSFGNPSSNMGVSSLEGMQIFDKGLFKNPRIAKNIYFPNSSLTDVDPLSFLEDAKNIFLNDGQLTNVDGLSNLRTVDTLNLGRNKLTDISGLTSLTSIDTLRLNDNQLTNNDMATLTSVFNSANPNYVDAAYNYFVLGDAESTQFFNNLMEITSDVAARSPQYNFEFNPTGNVKVEYRDRDTNELIDSEVFTNVAIMQQQTYYAKGIEGYSLDDDSEKTVSGFGAVESAVLAPKFLLRGIYAPDPNTSVDGLVDWNSVTFAIEDESVLTYDAANNKLEVLSAGSKDIDVSENGIYRGTYSVDTGSFGNTPVVFYYKSTAPSTTNHTLTILEPLGEGSVFPNAGTYEYPDGQTVSLSTNNSVPGYEFEKWVIDGDDVYYPNPFALWVDVVMDRDHVAQAVFKPTSPAQFTLSVNQIGEGLVSPAGVTNHFPLEPVTLTASPAAGHRFVKWVVNGVESFAPVMTITMNNNTTATAYFEPLIQYTLSVDHVGEGDVSPAGVSKFYELQTVNLTANPADGYKFVKWVVNGEEILTANITITMDRDIAAVAYFDLITPTAPNQFILTVNQVGEGATTPSSNNGELKYDKDVEVTLNADPSEGYVFVKWIVDGQEYSDAEITIKMDKNKTATAYFEPIALPPVTRGELTVEFRDSVTNEKIRDDEVLTDLELGEHSYLADAVIGIYELVGEALKKVVLTVAEPIQKIIYFYREKVITPPSDDDPVEPPVVEPPVEDDPVEPPVVQEPPTPPVVEEPADPPVVEVPAEPPVVEQPEEPISNEKPVVEDPIADEPVENEPVIVQEPVSDEGSSEDVQVSNDVSKVEKAPKLDQVRIVAIDVETDEVLTEEILRDLPLGKHEISAPAIEGYTPLEPSVQSVMIEQKDRQLVIEFKYREQKQYGVVFGVVTDANGNPMKGIQVELHSDPRVTYTNANGEYKFENVELGQHTVILKNPFTNEELGKIEIVVYQGSEQKDSRTESLKDASEIRTVIELNESENTRRIDFIIEPVEPKDYIPQIPQEPEPIEPKSKLPIIPIATAPLLIIVVILYFRRKNVVIYDISGDDDGEGIIIKKLRVKAKPETIIDLSGLEASKVRIKFKNPVSFRDIDLFLKFGEELYPTSLVDGQDNLEVTINEE
ncbi:leucine-rich repeat protein [Cohnella massiliensis]|uniref:leucine-rich repeat protein n=1 Tax=Cohnella massiliensis TaxID=1816691 RepID=UPI00159495E2|nr:leucine-rich repeat protein [Cohnella massiliensis]